MIDTIKIFPQSPANLVNFFFPFKKQDDGSLKNIKVRNEFNSTDVKCSLRTNIISTKIYGLNSDNYILKEPVDIVLKIYPNEVLAIIPDLELYGEGLTEIKALNDLRLELIDLYDDLNTIPAKELGKSPRNWKRLINSFIRKQNAN